MCAITGEEVWYAGGGAGFRSGRSVAGGVGGGGACDNLVPKAGTDGLGGGGCGGARGGSGVVVIRYMVMPRGTVLIVR